MIMLAEAGKFSPGDVVRHKRYDYRGVVVDIDPNCQASNSWYKANLTQPSRDQPWYHVLVDLRTHTTYVAQENLVRDVCTQPAVQHPLVDQYFDEIEDGHYHRNDTPWPRE
jgi:heat shock protein HspQ